MVYSMMHDRAHRKYRHQSLAFTIPVIVLSSLTGTANFATNSFDPEHRYKLSMIIGGLNLLSGLITTLTQFLRVNELCEGHRVASVAFSKFSRAVSITLSLPIYDRQTSGKIFLKTYMLEYDRLLEQSPVVPLNIVSKCRKEVADKDIHVPCFGIRSIDIYSASFDNATEQQTIGVMRDTLYRLVSLKKLEKDVARSIEMQITGEACEIETEEKDDTCCV